LTDRYGGRAVFTALMVIVAAAAAIVPTLMSYETLIAGAFVLGLAGASFSVGVGYVSRWTPQDRQGAALGIYGLGTIGQSAAVFLGPLAAQAVGWRNVFYAGSALMLIWAAVFGVFSRNAPGRKAVTGIGDMLRVLRTERLAWVLGAFYFLTFG